MTPEIMWSLLVALGAIAVAAVLDSVKHRRDLHLANEELSSSRKELDSLKEHHEQTVSDLKKLHSAEIEKLTNRIHQSDSLKLNAVNPQGEPYFSAAPRRNP